MSASLSVDLPSDGMHGTPPGSRIVFPKRWETGKRWETRERQGNVPGKSENVSSFK
ncbi:hypothetical protein Tco_1187553, partial [Tanacetum coccineum]